MHFNKDSLEFETRSLTASKWANLFMACFGVFIAWLANSNALLLDGVYSGIGFVSAIIAGSLGKRIMRPPDLQRPFGYEADEAIYVMLRSLSLVSLILFAAISSLLNILDFFNSGVGSEINYQPIVFYTVIIFTVCAGLGLFHSRNWRRTGQRSDILKLEAKAAFVDGTLSAAAGLALLSMPLFEGTSVSRLLPVWDSIILLILCVLIIAHPYRGLRQGIAELAGMTAPRALTEKVRYALAPVFKEFTLDVVDLAVTKLGRVYSVAVVIDPRNPVKAADIDQIADEMTSRLDAILSTSRLYVFVSERHRSL